MSGARCQVSGFRLKVASVRCEILYVYTADVLMTRCGQVIGSLDHQLKLLVFGLMDTLSFL